MLNGCRSLECLPSAIGGLGMLKELHLKDTLKYFNLPEDFGQLTGLTSLSVDNLVSVPEAFGCLKSLAFLHVGQIVFDVSGQFASSLVSLTALKTLHLCNYSRFSPLPRSFGDVKSLVVLEMPNCLALRTIEVLPQSLQHLDLANCRRLIDIPSFAGLSSLTFLNLCNCRSLRQVVGLECLIALEDTNLSGVTSLSECVWVVQSSRYRGLRSCCLRGSKVGVAYDNRWMERKPAVQLISCYGDFVGYFPNGMAARCLGRADGFDLVIEASILSKAECVALILCVVGHDPGLSTTVNGYYSGSCGMEVTIIRDGRVVSDTGLLQWRRADNRNQVHLWTLRIGHRVVQSLQHEDRICVYPRSGRRCLITVLQGAICVIHAGDDRLTLAINSELLSRSDSEEFATKLGELVVADDFHLPLTFANKAFDMELDDDEIDTMVGLTFGDLRSSSEEASFNEHGANPEATFGILSQQEWLIAPSHGR